MKFGCSLPVCDCDGCVRKIYEDIEAETEEEVVRKVLEETKNLPPSLWVDYTRSAYVNGKQIDLKPFKPAKV